MPARNGGWKPAFLAAFRNSGNVLAACRAAGISRGMAYKARAESKQFARDWDEAKEDAIDLLEARAWKLASDGHPWMIWKLLEANRRTLYGNKVEINRGDEGPQEVILKVVYDEGPPAEPDMPEQATGA